MRLSDAPLGHVSVFAVDLAVNDTAVPFQTGAEVEIAAASEGLAEAALLRHGSVVVPVAPADVPSLRALRDLLDVEAPRVCWVVGRTQARIVIQARSYPAARSYDEPVRVGVDDLVLDDLRRHMRSPSADPEQARRWLAEQCLLPGTPDSPSTTHSRLVASAGPTSDLGTALRVHGRDVAVDVRFEESGARVTRVVAGQPSADAPLTLLHADWEFTDLTQAAAASEHRHVLDQLVQDARGYLNLWQRYADLEEEAVLRRHASVGAARYDHVTQNAGVWRFHLQGPESHAFLDRLGTEDVRLMDAGARRPTAPAHGDLARQDEDDVYTGSIVRLDEERAAVELRGRERNPPPPPSGFLRPSLLLERVSFDRRRRAMTTIASGNGPMPWLGLLIEQREPPVQRRRSVPAMSPAARRHFPDGPTAMQERALDVALNTPDIAVIQGPPGTGKTQVIAALQTRLAEIEGSEAAIGRTVLLSSYQHDAVDHVLSRTTVMGLPAVKVGKRYGDATEDDGGAFEVWRQERVRELSTDTRHVREVMERQWRLRALVLSYASSPRSQEATRDVLLEAAGLVDGTAPSSVGLRLRGLAERHQAAPQEAASGDADVESLRAALAGLPSAALEFEHDGAAQVMRTHTLLHRSGLATQAELLAVAQLSEWVDGPPPEAVTDSALRAAQDVLARIDGPGATQDPQAQWPDEEVLAALRQAEEQSQTALSRSGDAADLAVARFAEALQNDELAARELAQTYASVLAATCQHAASKQMREMKGDSGAFFPTVIIDEAARANPLDLMIPMSLAGRRVVLVGDQRQLPHVLEPDIERELTETADERTRSTLRESLFQRLFEHLAQAEQTSGVRRVVTLDAQYRMHPVLGRFVSETFYGGPDAVTSPRPPEHFAHGLQEYGDAVAVWVDVPRQRGAERAGRSKSRAVEAGEVAEHAARILRRREDLSVGVITFYARQRQEIWQALSGLGVAEAEGSHFRPARGFERLRVGTVDAFQGSEFDVVLLSLTRSNDFPGDTEAEARRRWGFLTLQNRMNVAMSRQRRLLIAVGDEAMALGPQALRSVGALQALRVLCESGQGLVLR